MDGSTTHIIDCNSEVKKHNVSNVSSTMRITVFIKKTLDYFALEMFILCYSVAFIIPYQASKRLYSNKICHFNNENFTDEFCALIVDSEPANEAIGEIWKDIQLSFIDINMWIHPIASSISVIVTLILGSWSDRTINRKALLMLPVFGDMVATCGFLFAIYFSDWSLWTIKLLHTLPSAMAGGYSVILIGSYSYIADVTKPDSRLMRIGIFGVFAVLTSTFTRYASGRLLALVAPLGTYAIVLLFNGIALTVAFFQIKEERRTRREGTLCKKVLHVFNPGDIWGTIAFVIATRGHQLSSILLLVLGYVFFLGPDSGGLNILHDYLQQALHMDPSDINNYELLTTVTGAVGTTIAIAIFSKKLRLHDTGLGMIGVASTVAARIYFGVTWSNTEKRKRYEYYYGLLLDLFGWLPALAIRSLSTKVAQPNNVAKMCALINIVEGIARVVYEPIMASVYYKTMKTYPGAYLVISGILMIPVFTLFIPLYFLMKPCEDTVRDAAAEETPNENE